MDFSEQALRLMYAMALTRFVNGAFDVHYVTSPGLTKDIKTVLGHFGVPAYIVTLRHKCAHRALPSMEALKCGAGIALQWLMDNYWEPQRQHNQQREQNSVPKAPEATVSFSTVAKFRRPVKRTKSFLSDCSAMDLSQRLIHNQFLNISNYEVMFPMQADQQQTLPELLIERHVVAQWWQTVRQAAESRPGLETLVLSAIIIAMHDTQCTVKRRQFLAAWLGQSLSTTTHKGPCTWLNSEAVDWLEVFSVVQHNPGYYSDALMNIVIPHVKQDLHEDVIKRSKQVTQLMTMSEMFSQCAYTRPFSAAMRDRLGAEVTSVVNTRLSNEGDDDCMILQDPPQSKRAKLSSTKWSIATDFEQQLNYELGLCPGQEPSFHSLDLNFVHPNSHLSPQQATPSSTEVDERFCDQQALSKSEVARIQSNIHKHLNMITL
jgi:hypothetical protein